MGQFFGKYRGQVTANKDPLHLGRIQVQVPAVLGAGRASWALPCTPYAGHDIGLFLIPPIGTNIWVEFEGGDADYPIWSGCFWGESQLPQDAKVEDPDKVQVFRTQGITITLSNLGDNKGVSITVESPVVERTLKLIFDATGIEMNNKDETTVKLTAETIELKNKASSTLTIAADRIQQKESSVEVTLTANAIDLICNPATIQLSASSGIALANPPAEAKFGSSGIELSSSPAVVKLTPAQIELSNAAANVKLSPIGVNINNGALEVI